MAYDPNFPPDHQALTAAPFRAQYNELKALIDAQAAQIATLTAQQAAVNQLNTLTNALHQVSPD